MGRKQVVHLTSAHPSVDVRIFHKECKTLAGAGYEVTFIVPHDRDEVVDHVRIRAVAEPKSRRERMTHTMWTIYRAALAENAQVYHFHDPELIPVGLLLKLRGKRVIYDAHEDLPRYVLSMYWMPAWLRSLVSKAAEVVEAVSAWGFDGLIAATPAIGKRFPPNKTMTAQNFPASGKLLIDGAQPYVERPHLIVYVGDITPIRGTREMIRAMALLPETLEANLVLAGRFNPPTLKDEVEQMSRWERVEFVGWQSREGVANLFAKARMGLVLYYPVPNHMEAQPNKLFEYMSAGIPVIASDFPLWREIIEAIGCGILIDPLDPKAIAEAIQWLLEHAEEAEAMGKRGQEAVRTRYNWDVEAQKLLKFYSEVIA